MNNVAQNKESNQQDNVAQDGTELSEYDIAMRGMMKSKIGMGNVFGNPAIKRMSQAMPKTGMTPEGIGTHYMGSMDNYAVPLLQDFGGDELRLVNPNTRSREAIRFNSPEEAQYFAEHYKDVAPMSTMYKGLQEYAMGGSIPGAVGFSYARVGAPSKGPRRNQTDVTDASAQNGKEMSYYQNGLDFKPKSISKNGGWLDSYEDGGVIKDDMGQWAHPGEITEIGSNQITMQGVPYPVLGVSNTGDTQMMYPEEEYEFDGEKVTEYPIAQNGFDAKAFQKVLDKKFPRFWRKKKDINIRETNPVKKDNTNVNKKNKIIIPTTKEKATRSIQDQKEYMKGWMDSPMYNEMVDNSTTGISDKFFLNLDRDINHDDITIRMMNQNLPNDPNVGADSNSKTGLIRVYPEGYRGPQLEGMISHEISHTIDKPVNWGGIGGDLHKFLGDPYMNGKRAIPKKDIDLMQSYYKGNDSYTELFNKNALNNAALNEDREWFNYVSDPTETRARLNDIRYNAKKYNIYDPFTEKVDVEKLNEIRRLSKKAGGFDPFNQLRDVYSEDQIINMLNTISQNDTKEDRSISMAKNGIRQEQKGLVNLDQLTNFTNYNKPQPGGWLNKYN